MESKEDTTTTSDNNLLKDSIISQQQQSSSSSPSSNNNEEMNTLSSSLDVDIIPALQKISTLLIKEENRVKHRNDRELRLKQREQELKGKIKPKKNTDYTDLVNNIKDNKHRQWYMKAFDNPWSIPTIKVITSGIKLDNGTVVYKVLVKEISGKEWYIYRRYSDFLSVQQYLESIDDKEHAPVQAHRIPPKDWNLRNRVLFPLNEKRLEERRLGLEAWLQDLLSFAKEELSVHRLYKAYQAKLRIELAAFLDPPDDDEGDEPSAMRSVASLDQNDGDDNHIPEEEDDLILPTPSEKELEAHSNDSNTSNTPIINTNSIEDAVVPNPPAYEPVVNSENTTTIPKVLSLEEEEFLYEYTRKKREKKSSSTESIDDAESVPNDDNASTNDVDSVPIDATLSLSNDALVNPKDVYQKFVDEVQDINITSAKEKTEIKEIGGCCKK